MAFKSFNRLSTRNRGSIISQIHKLIKYYGDFFCIRDRTYLRDLTEQDGSIYWIAEGTNILIALALLEPDHVFTVANIQIESVGYLISKKPGYMDRLLQHIWSDFDQKSLVLFSKPNLAARLPLIDLNLVEFTATDLNNVFPDFANHPTTYFGVHEKLSQGLERRCYSVFFRLSEEDKQTLALVFPEFIELLHLKMNID